MQIYIFVLVARADLHVSSTPFEHAVRVLISGSTCCSDFLYFYRRLSV